MYAPTFSYALTLHSHSPCLQDCESLIEIGADVNWRNAEGDACLHAACRRGHAETIRLLLKAGADVNATGKDGLTALHISTKRGDAQAINALLVAALQGLDVSCATPEGATAMDFAQANGLTRYTFAHSFEYFFPPLTHSDLT